MICPVAEEFLNQHYIKQSMLIARTGIKKMLYNFFDIDIFGLVTWQANFLCFFEVTNTRKYMYSRKAN